MAGLDLTFTRTGSGQVITTINGKTYGVLAAYKHSTYDGFFFLAVTGKVPLRADDLAEKWRVVRSGDVYFAFALRAFSYHLAQGENAEVPLGCEWPALKAPPSRYAVVGPTEESVWTQVRLLVEQFAPGKDPAAVIAQLQSGNRGWWARNEATADGKPQALLVTL